MSQRKLYLHNTTLSKAYDAFISRCASLIKPAVELVATEDALGRVTSEPVHAALSSPSFTAAAMDGIAVVAAHTIGASETAPKVLRAVDDFIPLDTGDPLSDPYDAIIMAEDIVELDESVEIFRAAAPWQHVRPIGEDFAQGEMLMPSRHTIRPIDIGLALSGGVFELKVTRKPRVAIIPTGSELIDPAAINSPSTQTVAYEHTVATEQPRQPGAIIDSNSRMIAALVQQHGAIPCRLPIASDEYASLKATIKAAVASHDVVLINAGSSAGREDFTAPILEELGEVLVHGVAVKPGKPVILALVEGKPVIGLPGYPLATYFNFTAFAAPILSLYTNTPQAQQTELMATLSKRIVSSLKYREYVQVNVGIVDNRPIAVPLSRGAGIISSLARADGYLIIDQDREGLEAGEQSKVFLYESLERITQTLLAVGSHDLALDIIADLLPLNHPHMQLRSTHVGSLAGLNALARGEAHLAPTHLLDEKSGTYNIQAVKQVFREQPCVLIKGLERVQGIMVAPGNPLKIQSVEDLAAHRYINRQRGAGTRVLFDYLLTQANMDPQDIKGYTREATTHMAVASAIAAGSADAGMGVYSAAKTLGLDFIEAGNEEYDFAVPLRFLDLPHMKAFVEILTSPSFHAKLDELGGYGYAQAGRIVSIPPA